nr:MAG TPA: hypothetical protein [Caudoviricetes sp.]
MSVLLDSCNAIPFFLSVSYGTLFLQKKFPLVISNLDNLQLSEFLSE